MKILFLSSSFYPRLGGVETHVLEVSRELIRGGHSVTVVTEAQEYEKDDHYQSYDVGDTALKVKKNADKSIHNQTTSNNILDVHYLNFGTPGKLKKIRIWLKLWQKRKLIRDFEIVHCHDVFIWYLPFRFLFFNKRVYSTFHGYETTVPIPKKNILLRKLSERLSWGNICVGDYLKKWYGTKPTFVIYGGITMKTQNFGTKKSERRNLKLNILFLGRLEKDTGTEAYLDVLKNLRLRGMAFQFEACGDGSLRDRLATYGKVHGFVENVTEYMEKADIVFVSSYLSILEALSYKKPVVALYENDVKKDYLKMAPFAKWITISNDAEKVVGVVIKNEFNHKDAMQAYQWVKTQTWEKIGDIYKNLWTNKVPI